MTSRTTFRAEANERPVVRSMGRRLAIFGTAAALIVAPAFVAGTAANAADPFVITTPTAGETGVAQVAPNVVGFAGTGLPTADDVTVSYVGATGVDTASTGGAHNDGAGNWTELENFGQLGPGVTAVAATVTVVDAQTGVADPAYPVQTLDFTLAVAPNALTPFTITNPVSNAGTVVAPGDAFTGTGTPGDTITIVYGARAGQNLVAGTGTVTTPGGTWSIVPDFSKLEPGQTDGTAIITETTPAGAVEAGTSPTATNFTFSSAPAPAVPLTLTTDPKSSTLSSATTKGVAFLATGFSPDEQVTIAVKDSTGATVELAPAAAEFFASATDGSFPGFVILPSTAGTGTYTVTVTGVRSGRIATGTFTVVADPVTTTTPTGTGTTPPVESLPVVSG
ncbi:hypothetical protein AX769_19340 [Frondihabitans sp. PAMC 28766]|uniref:hypothetical protein n=1 Tax=Frondihabitans sp. PAMC 28766 TaxID=1795630 RepID=UPI00078B2080|nr:hypothetical protein [Frondihabitans sp. PAMC 28766]AMM21905.1 hypothetical protein AX769_19340 [Frondihabitans sp. PAMC 28766]